MQWFQALIPSYPEIQRRAQAELDTVVGRDRLPGAEDEKDLPYCRALIKEVERCYNPFWLSTPHFSTEDFVYKGQYIPKETMVVLNTWTIHHDEKRYPDPDTFNVSPPRRCCCYNDTPRSVRLQNMMNDNNSPIATCTTPSRPSRAPTCPTPASVTTGSSARGGASARPSASQSARTGSPSRASSGPSTWRRRRPACPST